MDGDVNVVRCANVVSKNGIDKTCNTFIAKFTKKTVHIKCKCCDNYTIISIKDGKLAIFHVNKDGEKEISNK